MKNSIEERLRAIEARNQKVEQDKAWETSWTRRIAIAVLIYGVVVSYLAAIGHDKPFIHGLVPPVGFVLSTLVLKSVRNFWEK